MESMNAQFMRSFKSHGSIYKFMECLALYEFTKASEMRQLSESMPKGQMEAKKTTDKERHDKVKHFTILLTRGEIDVNEFLAAMANKTILPISG